ncbi:hypothetical protein GVN21_17135 [Caulobacter sp. SLTY]|nr:hypothetical protein [Caulobacter sp. SLTY]
MGTEPTPPAGYALTTGTAGNNTLLGGAGSDAIQGLDGADTLYGAGANDWLSGGLGSDRLFGEAGDDVLYGGLAADTLTGGAGADRFVYFQVADSTASGMDVIRDFSVAEGDLLDVSLVDANAGVAGDQAFSQVASFTGVAGQMTVSAAGTLTTLSFDTNGDSAADMVIRVSGTVGTNWIL